MLLVVSLLISGFTTQTALAVEPATVDSPLVLFPYNSSTQEIYKSILQIVDVETRVPKPAVPDGELTLDIIKNHSGSWEEFVNYTIPITFGFTYSNIECLEDRYCLMLIQDINHTMTASIYHDAEYVKLGLGGFKFQAIIELYNKTNELDLVWQPEMLSEKFMQVDVKSTNLDWLEHPALTIGEVVQVRQGAKYWESSWNDGSGKYGIVTDSNPYFAEDAVLRVNGVSYQDDSRTHILSSHYCPYSKLDEDTTQIDLSRRMLHLCSDTIDLGWFYAEDVTRLY